MVTSSMASPGWFGGVQAAGDAQDIHEGPTAAEDLYMDRQCRHILLQPFGERWEAEVSLLHAAVVDGSDPSGTRVPA